MDRRVFLQWLGLGSVVGTMPSWINWLKASKGPMGAAAATPTTAPTVAQASAYIPVGTVSQLNQAGSIVNNHTPLGAVTVVRDQANQLKAVSPICPHQGCRVDWQASQGEFYCPCHGARFAAGGKVLAGPTRSDLPAFSTRVENGNVLVARTGTAAAAQTSESRYRSVAEEEDGSDDHGGENDREEADDQDDQQSFGQAPRVNA